MTTRGTALPGLLRLAPSLPFVGRSDELGALMRLWSQAAEDGRRIAILQGEAGSGKTRLARQVAEAAAGAGARVLHGACDPSLAPPYGPFVEALEQLAEHEPDALDEVARGPHGAALGALLPGVVAATTPSELGLEHSGGRFRLHAAVTDMLTAAARDRPVVLVLDDLHWAEAPTLLLLRHLARSTADARLLVLATTRDADADEVPELADALAEMHRLEGVMRMRVGGLAATEIEELLVRTAPQASAGRSGTLAGSLAELTGGNAFLVAEVVQHLADAELLDDDAAGGVTPASLDAVGVPEGVREVSRQRLARMTPDGRAMVELVAIGPRGMELAVLRRAAQADEAVLLDALEEAVASRMLEELPGPRIAYRFRHELLRRAVGDRLTASRRAALHLRVATALEAVHGDDERAVSDLAFHFARGADLGGRDRAVHHALRAAELAARSFAYEDAARRLRAALDLGIDDPALGARVFCDLGGALHRAGDTEEALEAYAASAELARRTGDVALLAEAAIGFENACWRPGLTEPRALELLAEAADAVAEGDSPLRTRVLSGMSRAHAYRGDHETAAVVWREAVDMARRVGDPRSLGVTLSHAVWTRGSQSPRAVLASLDEACELFGGMGDDDVRQEAGGFRLSFLLEDFDMDGLRRALVSLRDGAARFGQPFYGHVYSYTAATLAVCDGRLAEAERLINQAFELSRQFDEDSSAIHGIQRFTLERERGKLAAVAPVIRAVAQESDEQGTWGPAFALLLAELGMLEEAGTTLRRLTADDLAGVSRGGLWLAGLVYLAETCTLVGDDDVARTLYAELRELEGRNLVIGQAVACYGAADRHLGMLAATAGDLDTAERHLEAALVLNGRLDSPTWIAHTQFQLARTLQLRGDDGDHARAGTLLASALDTARTVGLAALERRVVEAAGAVEVLPDGLSPREVQVLRLVAGGLSNRDIGASLQISRHTAANHVRSILAKTGAANRTEATAYAYRNGLVTR